MKELTKHDTARSKARSPRKATAEPMRRKIARFAAEFMLKPAESGFDAVGDLVKSRRAS